MRVHPIPSQTFLREILSYDPDSGLLTWKERASGPAFWNSRYAGTTAFNTIDSRGYKFGKISRVRFSTHRIIFKMETGEEPECIDHIDGDKTNNKWSNLRKVTWSQNRRNAAKPKTNTSGCAGVKWFRRDRRWRAYITVDLVRVDLGSFKEFKDAVASRKHAERKYGFHPNHGREKKHAC